MILSDEQKKNNYRVSAAQCCATCRYYDEHESYYGAISTECDLTGDWAYRQHLCDKWERDKNMEL